jgi:hypothetical protein
MLLRIKDFEAKPCALSSTAVMYLVMVPSSANDACKAREAVDAGRNP